MDNPSLSQLQKLLSNHTEEAESIRSDLEKARQLLSSCDERLQKLVGGDPSALNDEPQKESQKSLKQVLKDVLSNTNEPLTVKEIAEMVLESGHKTTAKGSNFCNIVLHVLKNAAEFKRKTRAKTRPQRYVFEGLA